MEADEIKDADIDLARALPQFDRSAHVRFANGSSARVGHFIQSSSAGCGCDHNGVAFIDDHALVPGDLNQSLIEYQGKWWHCGGADADLTRIDGETYVDARAGKMPGRKTTPRVLLQIADGKVRPLCRIDRAMTVTPVPPSSPGKREAVRKKPVRP
jgi:hypothetical protein